ncbi:hypothetical protein [Rathayibacter rathayi]|nr:hypothetical protein [Rathayibacter rathayi]TWD70277.1 hypothetical protein FB469_2057 [Rathayibacter rathayi]SOE06109.1 hypothetical protein SAMN06295924_1401 [Rathayibacter rathayi NCPPB 2980 = VKM Ac-1601]
MYEYYRRELLWLIEEIKTYLKPQQEKYIRDYVAHREFKVCLEHIAYELDELEIPLPGRIVDKVALLGVALKVDPREWQDLARE